MRTAKNLAIAGGFVAAALVGGTLINVVFAAPSSAPSATSAAELADKAAYCETWKEAFAKELGVSVDDLLPAAKAASIAAIDAAVEAGDLTEERATELKAKIEAFEGNGCRFLGHPFFGGGHGPKLHIAGGELLNAAAEALGMEPGELIQALRSGDSLEDVASAQGKDYDAVKQAVLDAAKTELDAAVADGLDQARADELLSRLDEALDSGDFPRFGPGRGHWFHGGGDDADESEAPST